MVSPWAMIVTAPNSEHRVARELRERRNVPHHFFQRAVQSVYRGRVFSRLVPAFPRYIFAPPEVCWALRREMPSRVVDVVRSHVDGTLWTVSNSEMESLVARCAGGNTFPSPQTQDPYTMGDEVIIVGHHAAAGHRAVYQHMLGDNHALVLFSWLGRMVPTNVDLRDIEKWEPKERQRRRHRRRRRASRSHH
jgi:hypothetical protein